MTAVLQAKTPEAPNAWMAHQQIKRFFRCGEESIRDVMAFPKNNRGIDLMSHSPTEVDPRQLRDLGIKLADEKKSGQD